MTPALDRGRPKARPRPNQLSLPESPLHEIQAVRLLENGLWLVDRGRRFPKDVATLGCSGLGAFPGSPAPVGKVAGPSRIDLLTLVVGQCRQIVKAAGHVWVLRAQGLFQVASAAFSRIASARRQGARPSRIDLDCRRAPPDC